MLRLEVLDHTGPTAWRWRLSSAGTVLAEHVVSLDPADWQYEAFLDLQTYLRSFVAVDRRDEQEQLLLSQVGDWLRERVLGPVAVELARQGGVAHLELPAGADVLGYLPWELALGDRVTFVVVHQPRTPRPKQPVGERLRMLAVFSLPEGAQALNLRKQRYALTRLVHTIAQVNGKAIELRVVQYGASRERLREALLEAEGWDVVHLAGHGLPARVVLETSSGGLDLVGGAELVELLELAAQRIKLVVEAAGSLALAMAEERLLALGLEVLSERMVDAGEMPTVATGVAKRLDCAVVAMRYQVEDDFAIDFVSQFYDLVLGKGQSVARALSLVRAEGLNRLVPVLFGAGELTLVPPDGEPLVFQPERVKLAEFPPQPDRFVGRVGPMARASAALAPHSGMAGVLFHGMAGGGKTACAVELAYTHHDSFPLLAWYAAGEVRTALTGFALALERQLPGLKFVHTVNDIELFRQFLPSLTQALEQQRVLIVLDNAETLLTADGQWRDERWELLIDAMTSHKGLSRLVITSRTRPRLPASVAIEAVHALEIVETFLLAREWPNLRALLDGDDSLMAAQVLSTVQGHPKLVELANGIAADREALRERLIEARDGWMRQGVRLEPFLRGEDPVASADDYLSVLTEWTQATVRVLPERTRQVFLTLCCAEDNDRRRYFIRDSDEELALLADRALIEVVGDYLSVHPGVAEAGRELAGDEFARAVDEQFANIWVGSLRFARDTEETAGTPDLLVDAAINAAPYLHRLGRWDELGWAAEIALRRDGRLENQARLYPFLEAAAAGTTTLPAQIIFARVVSWNDRERGEAMIRDLLARAVATGEFGAASTLAHDLISVLRATGRLDEALVLARQAVEHTRRAGLGPWSQASDEREVLQILFDQGDAQSAYDGARRLLASLPETSDATESVAGWHLRESLLNLASISAATVGDHEAAAAYAEELFQRGQSRNNSPMEQVVRTFNMSTRLVESGRIDEAREALAWCRKVSERHGDINVLAQVIGMLADIEDQLGHHSRAIELKADALRFAYMDSNPTIIGMAHHDLAVLHARIDNRSPHVWAHYLAAALIAFRVGHRTLEAEINALGVLFFAHGMPERSLDDACALVEETDGVRFRELLATLPQRAPNELVLLTNRAVEHANEIMRDWQPIMSAVLLTALGEHDLREQLEPRLADMEQHADAAVLARVLRRVLAGERGSSLVVGLPLLPYGIVSKILANLPAREGS